MSALWLFPLPFQLLSELSHPWLLEVPAGQEQCPRSWRGAQGPSGISVQALQPGLPWWGCWRWALEQPGFSGSWISFVVQEAVVGELRYQLCVEVVALVASP